MSATVDRLFILFTCFFAGLITLCIGYSVVPSLFLGACCCVVGTLTVITALAAAIFWAISTRAKA